ncbi:hypothetical protein SAY87_018869 [Trapa incisa]|uniref:Longin domain-containing protein n=1 Tax=Trapa incisa TaxID=236973 RepID=A0AAN7K4U7_9MYRT|nr:hypothetical protein SAY87_018869 [Trapa incisa]
MVLLVSLYETGVEGLEFVVSSFVRGQWRKSLATMNEVSAWIFGSSSVLQCISTNTWGYYPLVFLAAPDLRPLHHPNFQYLDDILSEERERERERPEQYRRNGGMKITALLVLKVNGDGSDPVILSNASDVSHFGYFQRSSVKEFIVFVGRTVAKRTQPGQRQSVQHEEYKVHAYNKNGLCTVGFMDDHYPVRSAFSLLNQVLDEYLKSFGDSWRSAQADNTQPWPYLNEALTKYQDPAEADKLLKIQRELDETKIILVTHSFNHHLALALFSLYIRVSQTSLLFFHSTKPSIACLLEVRDWTVLLRRVQISVQPHRCSTSKRRKPISAALSCKDSNTRVHTADHAVEETRQDMFVDVLFG